MRINQRLMRHAPGPQFMQPTHSGRRQQGFANRRHLRFIQAGIDQLLELRFFSPPNHPCYFGV